MLIAFYSTLIIFFILFIFTLGYLIHLILQKRTKCGNVLALSSLLLLTGIISGLYGFDFYKLQAGEVQLVQGKCLIEFDQNGRSIATTSVEIDEKVYQIKGDIYKDLPDGTYQCKINYLPVTKSTNLLEIENK